jgi:2-oxoisovalerate dehydrogenase E2 component (dihydrolipoyl transacylase)
MSRQTFKLPDLGEGTVSAEIVAWRVNVGDVVKEDQPVVEMSTEKAVVEVPSPTSGRVVALNGNPGDVVAVGAALIEFDTASGSEAPASTAAPAASAAAATAAKSMTSSPKEAPAKHSEPAIATTQTQQTGRVMASPATRRRAHEAGIDLTQVRGTGPSGRIQRSDLEAALSQPAQSRGTPAKAPGAAREGVEEIKVLGVRRVIAQRMSEAKRNIPHFSYVEEVDVTALEALRKHLNSKHDKQTPSLTFLPFVVAALTRVLEEFPNCNAHFDASRDMILRHRAVHAGIATQTKDGLKVPVVRNAESRSLEDLAAEIRRVTSAARDNTAKRDELSGSTITVTSLGKLGGIVSTPVINSPEVAIVGLNRAVERPMVVNGTIAIRLMMNLSSSFDHRFVDGFDAAAMIQALKERLEYPATIFC